MLDVRRWWPAFRENHPDLVGLIEFISSLAGLLSVLFSLLPGSILVYLLITYRSVVTTLGKDVYYTLVTISTLGWVIAFLFAVRYAASKHQLQHANQSIVDTLHNIRIAEARVTEIAAQRDLISAAHDRTINIFTRVYTRFFELALANAECDKSMFDIFFTEMMTTPIPVISLRSVEFMIEHNIERNLADARYIFTQHTGQSCAICVKVIDDPQHGDTSPRQLRVSTQWRDPITGRSNRATGDTVKYTLVGGNTPDEVLFTSLAGRFYDDVWACDNLLELEKCGLYANSRDYYRDFNATLVAGIRNLDPDRLTHWRAFFCVDNNPGGLNNEAGLNNDAAKFYAREFAARLSVMIYRFKMLRDNTGRPWIKSTMTTRVSRT